MSLLGLKWFNLTSYLYLLLASFIFSGDFIARSTERVYVMPAPFAFSIWLLIYLLLFIFIITSFFSNEEGDRVIQRIGLWFPISMILSGTSVIVGTTPSILFIALSLLTLCVVYTILKYLDTSRITYRIPFSIYLAWTSIATIVDVFVVLKANRIEEILTLGELRWSMIVLTGGGLIAAAFFFLQQDSLFPLVFVWGYGAIFAYQDNTYIRLVTGSYVILLFTIVIWKFIQNRRVLVIKTAHSK